MILFQENFQTTLSQWTSKGGITHHGLVVPDPLGSNDKVLVFIDISNCTDLISPAIQNPGTNYMLSFDYLGKPLDNTITENLGCSIGIGDLNSTTKIYAAAISHGLEFGANNSEYIVLADDSSWHHYTIPFSFTGAELRLTLQDWGGPMPARAGDCYFKNILLTNDTVAESNATTHSPRMYSEKEVWILFGVGVTLGAMVVGCLTLACFVATKLRKSDQVAPTNTASEELQLQPQHGTTYDEPKVKVAGDEHHPFSSFVDEA
jgi:hypothetical protein